MTYEPLARKYRPQQFSEVVGQNHITETLRAAIAGGRVAAAYLFAGQRGSGKTTVARIVAKAVNCDALQGGEPCGECGACRAIAAGSSLDVLEIDGASNNSVDDVRELRQNVGYAASAPGKRKVYIIDEVHMLSPGAFNALLKTLEEPPPHVLFIFATTEPLKVPDTIHSRCQRFDFRRLLTEEIRERLRKICAAEKHKIDDDALFLLAKRADGSMRDGLSLLDQVVSSSRGKITAQQLSEILGLVPTDVYFDLTRAILERDARHGLEVVHGALRGGADALELVNGLVEHFRNLLLLGIDPSLRTSVALGDVQLDEAQALAARFKPEDLLFLLNRTAALFEDVRRSPQPVLGLEAGIVEMTRFESRVVLAELLERLQPGGGGAQAGPSGPGGPSPGAGGRSTTGPAGGPAGRSSGPPGAGPSRRSGPRAAAADQPIAAGMAPAAELPATARVAESGVPLFAAGEPTPARPAGNAAVQSVALEFADVATRWMEFAHLLRDSKTVLAHCLSDARPVRLTSGIVELECAPENSFQLHALQEAIKERTLDPYLRTFFGKPLKLALAAPVAGAPSVPVPARLSHDDIAQSRRDAIADVVQQAPAINDIIQLFDGEVLDDGGA